MERRAGSRVVAGKGEEWIVERGQWRVGGGQWVAGSGWWLVYREHGYVLVGEQKSIFPRPAPLPALAEGEKGKIISWQGSGFRVQHFTLAIVFESWGKIEWHGHLARGWEKHGQDARATLI